MANRYWVGDTGNTGVTTHWSATSGGTGGASVPTWDDDVIFDASSFTTTGQIVTLSSAMYCKSMDWTGVLYTPSFNMNSASYAVYCYGSLTFIADMILTGTYAGRITLSGIGWLTTAGHTLYSLNISYSAVGWVYVYGDLTVTNGITLNQGSLDTNNVLVTASFFDMGTVTGSSRLQLQASLLVLNGNSNPSNILRYTANSYVYSSGSIIRITKNSAINIIGTGLMTNIQTLEITNKISVSINGLKVDSLILPDSLTTYSAGVIGNISLTFTAGSTYIINGITGIGSYVYPILFTSTGGYSVSTNTAINLEYYAIRNFTRTGTGSLTANNSANIENNSGITFTGQALSYQKLYWIGGTGTTSDEFHWARMSGGVGGVGVPTIDDGVIFDSNSFVESGRVVTFVGVSNIFKCKNINFTGVLYNPTMNITTNLTIQVHGYIGLDANMSISGYGLYLTMTDSGWINTAGHTLKGLSITNYIITPAVLTANIQSDINIDGLWNINTSTVYSNDHNITCVTYFSNYGRLYMGTSLVTVTSTPFYIQGGTAWDWVGGTLKLTSPSPVIANIPCIIPTVIVDTFAVISFTNLYTYSLILPNSTTSSNADLVFNSGYTYKIDAITGSGNTLHPIIFRASSTSQYNITTTTGATINITVLHYSFRYCNKLLGTITANNSVDAGNNTNVIFATILESLGIYYGTIPIVAVYKGTTNITHTYKGTNVVF